MNNPTELADYLLAQFHTPAMALDYALRIAGIDGPCQEMYGQASEIIKAMMVKTMPDGRPFIKIEY
jgi:hypothetical protein